MYNENSYGNKLMWIGDNSNVGWLHDIPDIGLGRRLHTMPYCT